MKIKIPSCRPSILAAISLLLMGFTGLNGKSLVLPVEAIDDAATMTAKEFNDKHQGIDVSGYYPDDPGYYVGYTHENLTFYFGPLEEYIEAIEWKDKLTAVREDVVYKRPTLGSSEVVIYNLTLETIEEHGRSMKQEAAGRGGSSSGEIGQMTGQSGQTGDQGQESGIIIVQNQTGQEQGQKGGQSGRGQQGSPIIQIPGQQGQQSGQGQSSSGGSSSNSSGGSTGSSGSSGGGSSSSNSSGGGGGGKPSWWEMIKGIFGG